MRKKKQFLAAAAGATLLGAVLYYIRQQSSDEITDIQDILASKDYNLISAELKLREGEQLSDPNNANLAQSIDELRTSLSGLPEKKVTVTNPRSDLPANTLKELLRELYISYRIKRQEIQTSIVTAVVQHPDRRQFVVELAKKIQEARQIEQQGINTEYQLLSKPDIIKITQKHQNLRVDQLISMRLKLQHKIDDLIEKWFAVSTTPEEKKVIEAQLTNNLLMRAILKTILKQKQK